VAEIQKTADQVEQKPDEAIKKPDNLGKDRAVTSDQVAEADAQRTSKFSTFGDMKAYADSNPLLIDMGDGTEVSSKGAQVAWKPEEMLNSAKKGIESVIFPHRDDPEKWIDRNAAKLASSCFSRLSDYSKRHQETGAGLIVALMKNEQTYYQAGKDGLLQDAVVRRLGAYPLPAPLDSPTIGPGQIKLGTIEYLAGKYPNVFGTKEATVPLATDTYVSTLLVGAYLDDRIEKLDRWSKTAPDQTKLTHDEKLLHDNCLPLWKSGEETKALIKSFNPADKDHLANVLRHLETEKSHH